jgi:hypothetical protein
MKYRIDPMTYSGLENLGRIPLSRHFHLREFLYSEIAVHYQRRNVPDDVDRAVWAGSMLCQKLLDPLQDQFGRVHVRSGYRSRAVNREGFLGKRKCAEDNDGAHTWDYESKGFGFGAMASISVPNLSRRVLSGELDVATIAWWVVDHFPEWSVLEFFATADVPYADEVVFNIGWNQTPQHVITNWRGGRKALHNQIPDPAARAVLWGPLDSA